MVTDAKEPSYLRCGLEEAKSLLDQQISRGLRIAAQYRHEEVRQWHDENKSILRRMFTGEEAADYEKVADKGQSVPDAHTERIEWLKSLWNRLRHFELRPESHTPRAADVMIPGKRVFLAHGHDVAMQAVARTLEKLGLSPIILNERPNRGQLILEKLESHSDVGFAVCLLTPDDNCAKKRRARQNVIFELGYFLAKLGRNRVMALYKRGVELPSDMQGWLYTELDKNGAWRTRLAEELKAAGLDVNLNDLTPR